MILPRNVLILTPTSLRLLKTLPKRSRSSQKQLKKPRKLTTPPRRKPKPLLSLFQEVRKTLRKLKKRRRRKRKKKAHQSLPLQLLLHPLIQRHQLENQSHQVSQPQNQRKTRKRKMESQHQFHNQLLKLTSLRSQNSNSKLMEEMMMKMRMMVNQLTYHQLKFQEAKLKSQRKLLKTHLLLTTLELNWLRPKKPLDMN